jgi:hypothetical protein
MEITARELRGKPQPAYTVAAAVVRNEYLPNTTEFVEHALTD